MQGRMELLLLVVACVRTAEPERPTEDAVQTFQATLRVDAEAGAKRFQGVWLDRPGARISVTGRAVTLSPFAAHLGGPTLWIAHFEPAP